MGTQQSDGPRVWHLLGPIRPSGMERMLVSVASEWPESLAHQAVIGQGDEHPYRSELERAGYEVHAVPPVRSRAGARALRSLLRLASPDVLHVHTESAYVRAVYAAPRGTAVVRTIHNVFPTSGRASWSRRVQAPLADRRVKRLVAPSQDVRENEQRLGRECTVVHNWVAPEFLIPIGDRPAPSWAVIVGNSSPIKNHQLALEAIMLTDMRLAMLGSEAGASPIERRLLDELESAGRMMHRGTGDPLPWLLGASVFAMPSLHEGMPVALAEAIQLGIPAVVSDAPGLRWAHGLPGVTVARGGASVWARALGAAALTGVDPARSHPDFSPARGAREYARIYSEAAGADMMNGMTS